MLMIEKKMLILCKSPIQGLGDTKSTAEKEHAINFYEQQKKSCLSLYYNGEKRFFFFFVNGFEVYKIKAKNSEINAVQLCLGKLSKYFSADNLKNTRLH